MSAHTSADGAVTTHTHYRRFDSHRPDPARSA